MKDHFHERYKRKVARCILKFFGDERLFGKSMLFEVFYGYQDQVAQTSKNYKRMNRLIGVIDELREAGGLLEGDNRWKIRDRKILEAIIETKSWWHHGTEGWIGHVLGAILGFALGYVTGHAEVVQLPLSAPASSTSSSTPAQSSDSLHLLMSQDLNHS